MYLEQENALQAIKMPKNSENEPCEHLKVWPIRFIWGKILVVQDA